MNHLCTVSDINFLAKGLSMYDSILETTKSKFILHYLCIDDESYDKLKKLNIKNLEIYSVSDFLKKDTTLKKLSLWDYRYFCWSLASYFSNFLQNTKNISIMYIDSDIFFHQDIELIYQDISEKSIGMFRHRQFGLNQNRPEGFYNVGVLFFKNNDCGKKILNWWSDAVLNMKYPELSTCGDQKYLDYFSNLCENKEIFIDGNIGHGAPWHWQIYDLENYSKDGTIIWEGKIQNLVFTHFSQFQLLDSGYVPSTMHHIYTPMENYSKNIELKKIYDLYYNKLLETKEKYL